ncbi:MAG TPA: AraC family transcriptional regulator [Pyrinomonadaceae bacterium]|jgi:AraC family transcriptional regulator|nr:AraC family transcriptional regulator [Pyrinomonadaceae bacterium]
MEANLPGVGIYGKTTKSCRVSGLRIAETTYASGLRVPKHSHEHGYFSLVLEGTFDGLYGGSAQKGKPFDAVFRPPDEPHSVHFHGTGARLFSIEVETSRLEQALEYSLRLDRSTELVGGQLAWLAFRIYREARAMDEVSALAIEGLFLEMMAEASRCSRKVAERHLPRWLKLVKEIIDVSFADNLTIAAMAETVGVHPVHLATTFRKHYRCTIGESIRQRRVEYASRQLSLSDASLVEIALAAGFSDQSHFSKTFKHFTGLSPARFRATFRRA